jgi:formylglycine-generating enzyme
MKRICYHFTYICITVIFCILNFSASGQTDMHESKKTDPVKGNVLSAFKAADRSLIAMTSDNSLNMRYLPVKKFKTGKDDSVIAVVDKAFWIAENEITYEQWRIVYDWACDPSRGGSRYYFYNSGGRGGHLENDLFQPYKTGHERDPVTTISWRDAVVWCNAFTEYCNEMKIINKKLLCVYYKNSVMSDPIRDSRDAAFAVRENTEPGSCDNPFVNNDVNGFRLPKSIEWEFAAKYIEDKNNNGDIIDEGEYYPGSHVSGDISGSCYSEKGAVSSMVTYYAWFFANSSNSTHAVTAKKPNAVGLFDMSGNVWEWCVDSRGGLRVIRGGSWYDTASAIQIGYVGSSASYYKYDNLGIRVVRSE